MPKIPKSFTTVTTFSKLLALSMFIIFPIIGFFLGTQYENARLQAGLPAIKLADTSSDSMADWKTYLNSKYLYSFKYPSDLEFGSGNISPWSTRAYGGSGTGGVILDGNSSPKPIDFKTLSNVHLYQLDNGESIDIKAINYFAPLINYNDWSLTTKKINGNNVEVYTNKTYPITIYRFKNSTKQIQVDFLATILNKTSEPSNTFLNILSTFKFSN